MSQFLKVKKWTFSTFFGTSVVKKSTFFSNFWVFHFLKIDQFCTYAYSFFMCLWFM